MNHIQTAWNEHEKMKFPVSIYSYHSAPENKDKHLMLAITYAAGNIQTFLSDGHLDEPRRQSLVASKEKIESSLDIQDESGRVYLEMLNNICVAVLDASGHQYGAVPPSSPAAQRSERV